MNERDELSREARALIAIGREGDQPSPADRARGRARLLAGLAGTAAAVAAAKTSAAAQLGGGAAGAGTGATAAGGVLSAKLAGGVLAVVLAAAGAGAVVRHIAQRGPAAERSDVAQTAHAPSAAATSGNDEPAVAPETRPRAAAGLGPSARPATPEPSAAPSAAIPAASVAAASDDVAPQEVPAAGAAPVADSPSPTAIAAAQLNPVRDPVVRATGTRARARAHRAASAAAARKPSMAASGAPAQAAAPQPVAASTTSDAPGEQADVAPSLRRELTLIAAAQAALARNAPDEALRWLDAHAAGYASGALVQERLAARAVALCALGRNAEGRRAAGDLARLAPHSPLLGRARRACAADGP
jgi:DNA polymerase-3 subunit gamma/tau